MKKGFTLVELLGVIILLSLVLTLVAPRIINSMRDSQSKVNDLTKTLIYTATENLINDNKNLFKKVNGNRYCVELRELVDTNYINEVELDNKKITDNMSVQITYNNGYVYELVNKNECSNINGSEQIFSIVYNKIIYNNYPKFVKKGESIKINFGSYAPESLEIYIDGTLTENYEYLNGTLLLKNIQGNIEIFGE